MGSVPVPSSFYSGTNTLKHGTAYVDAGQAYYERQYQARVVRSLEQRARTLGFELVPTLPEVAVT